METKLCPNCQGLKGEDGLTGYMVRNVYDETLDRWVVCELCYGSGVVTNITLKELNFLLSDAAVDA